MTEYSRAKSPLLSVADLQVAFRPPGHRPVQAVRGVSFDVGVGESVGIVGESGCGKSVTALSVLGLLPAHGAIDAGAIRWRGEDLRTISDRRMREVRGGDVSMIFQDPMTSLNPVFTIGQQLHDVQRAHGVKDRAARHSAAVELLTRLGIADAADQLRQYPHQFSGGMLQRVMIAMALLNSPALLIADEPTTALDVTVQAQILELLRTLRTDHRMALLLISHDLRVISESCDRMLVFYAGRVVESGATADVLARPQHPYTQGLLRALPGAPDGERRHLTAIPGAPPSLDPPPTGCAFAPRCPKAFERCVDDPSLMAVTSDHASACWLAEAMPAALGPETSEEHA